MKINHLKWGIFCGKTNDMLVATFETKEMAIEYLGLILLRRRDEFALEYRVGYVEKGA